MAYPPSPPPADRLNTTPQVTNHPGDHNLISENVTDIVNELGANPSGTEATVEARLDTIETELFPVGAMVDFAGTSLPPGNWMLCDGSSLDTTTYATLFDVIDYDYGGAAASFLLPDFTDRSAVGPGPDIGTTIGGVGGSNQLQEHTHTSAQHQHGNGTLAIDVSAIAGGGEGFVLSGEIGSPVYNVDAPTVPFYNFSNRDTDIPLIGNTADKIPDPTGEAGTGDNNYHPVLVVNKIIRFV
jgi:microcystin-dependent protein